MVIAMTKGYSEQTAGAKLCIDLASDWAGECIANLNDCPDPPEKIVIFDLGLSRIKLTSLARSMQILAPAVCSL